MTTTDDRPNAATGTVLDLPNVGWVWRDNALCAGVDPETFTIGRGNAHPHPDAAELCDSCPVARTCLIDACRAGDTVTFRGGMTPVERHRWVLEQGLKPAGFISGASQKPMARSGPRRDIATSAVVALVRQGRNFDVIAELLGCSARTAQRRYQAWLDGRPTPDEKTPVTLEAVAELHRAGHTIRQIAAQLGCAAASIQWRIKAAKDAGLIP